MSKTFVIVMACVALFSLLMGSAQALQTWDLYNNYAGGVLPPVGIGPEGVWSYGYDSNPNDSLLSPFAFSAFGAWNINPGYDYYSITSGTLPTFGQYLSDVNILIHTDYNANKPVIARWTAPRQICVRMSGKAYKMAFDAGNGRMQDFGIRRNSEIRPIVSGTISDSTLKSTNPIVFSTPRVSLAPGNVLDFWTVRNPSSIEGYIGIEWTITEVDEARFPMVVLAYDTTGDFGPGTPNTTTAGWQEAINYCFTNRRDLYVKGGIYANGLNVPVYNISSTITIPATKNFKITGGNYIVNWQGALTSNMLVFDSARNCDYELGKFEYSGTGTAVKFKPETLVDGQSSIRDTRVKMGGVIKTVSPGGTGVLFDTNTGSIWVSDFCFNTIESFEYGILTPNSAPSPNFVYNTVKALDIHSGASNSRSLYVGSKSEINIFDVSIRGDSSPLGARGVDVDGRNNTFVIRTSGGFPVSSDVFFEPPSSGNQADVIASSGISDPRSIITDNSTAATNTIRWIGGSIPIFTVLCSTGTYTYTQKLFPAHAKVEDGTIQDVRVVRGGTSISYGPSRSEIMLSPGDQLQIDNTVAPTIFVTPHSR